MSVTFRNSNAALVLGCLLFPLVGIGAGCAAVTGGEGLGGQTLPGENYSRDEVQYFSDGAANKQPEGTSSPHLLSLVGTDIDGKLVPKQTPARHANRHPGKSSTTSSNSVPKRQMIYTGEFTVATTTVNETIVQFIEGTEQIGGYLESRNDNHVIVRVPAASFDQVADNMSSLGDVLRRSIKNEDVTRQHRDLQLRIEGLSASHQRILELLKRADKIEDIVKLEARLAELTLQLERAQGEFKTLGEQIAYSRVEVDFQTKSVEAVSRRTNKQSPFEWINSVGADDLAHGTMSADMEPSLVERSWTNLWPGAIKAKLPNEFLIVERNRKELKAVTANDARMRIRRLGAPRKGSLDFWSQTLVNHLVNNRGYQLVQERPIQDSGGRNGRELTFDVVTGGTPTRYLTTLFVEQRPFWSRNNEIEVTEFVAPKDGFEQYVAAYHQSRRWQVADEQRSRFEPQYARSAKPSDDDLVRGQSNRR